LLLIWLFAPLLANVIVVPVHRLLFAATGNQPKTLQRARFMYLATHRAFTSVGSIVAGAGLVYFMATSQPAGILLVLFFLTVFVLIRYFAGESLTRFPVVYLRAFSSDNVFHTFTSVIAPAISSVHVIVGLTPKGERKKLIKGHFGPSTAALYVVPDKVWQVWVQRELERAYAVILDFSVPTENLTWELGEALRVCDRSRITMFVQDGMYIDAPQEIGRIALGATRTSRSKARRELRHWLMNLQAPS
jgi:hypothetical protein